MKKIPMLQPQIFSLKRSKEAKSKLAEILLKAEEEKELKKEIKEIEKPLELSPPKTKKKEIKEEKEVKGEIGSSSLLGFMKRLKKYKFDFSKLVQLKLIFLASTAEESGLAPVEVFKFNAREIEKLIDENDFEYIISQITSKKDSSQVSFFKIKSFIEDIGTISKQNQQQSSFMNDVMKEEDQPRAPPSDPIIANLIAKMFHKLEEKYTTIRQAYKMFDTDNSTNVSYKEFQRGLDTMGIIVFEKDCRKMFNYIDKDISGELSYVEFSKCYEQTDLKKEVKGEAEKKFLCDPISETLKSNYLHDAHLAAKKGKKAPKRPLFGIANSGQSSYSSVLGKQKSPRS